MNAIYIDPFKEVVREEEHKGARAREVVLARVREFLHLPDGRDYADRSSAGADGVGIYVDSKERDCVSSPHVFAIPGLTEGFLAGRGVLTSGGLNAVGDRCPTVSCEGIRQSIIFGVERHGVIVMSPENMKRYKTWAQGSFEARRKQLEETLRGYSYDGVVEMQTREGQNKAERDGGRG